MKRPPSPRRAARPGLRVSVTNGRGGAPGGPAAGLGLWLAKAAPRSARGDVSIALITDSAMRRLNGVHRGKDKVTDVLSFPTALEGPSTRELGPRRTRAPENPSTREPVVLGDIAIARGLAGRQAREAGHALRTELRILALHGLLHLLGYDHEGDHGQMERVEERLRRRAGLPAGLIARVTRSDRRRR